MPHPTGARRPLGEHERKDRELRLIAEVSAMIGRASPLRTILDCIATRVADLLATPYAAILLLTLDGRQMSIEGAYGLSATYIAAVNSKGLPHDEFAGLPSLEVCRSGKPRTWDNMQTDPGLAYLHEAQRLQGISSMIAVPLYGPEGPLGTLNCYHPRPGRFGARDIQLLTRVGAHAAQAIYNAHLVDRLGASIRRLSEMNELVQRQNSILARSDAIHRQLTALVLEERGLGAIVETLAALLRCGVQLYDAELGLLTGAAPADSLPMVTLDARALDLRALLSPGRQQTVMRLEEGPGVSAPALLCPISARGKTLGFLVVPAIAIMHGELELRALEHAATVCALELLKQRVGQEVAWRQAAMFFDDLLSGRLGDEDEIRRRLRYLGYSLDDDYSLLLVAPDNLDTYIGREQLSGQQLVDLKQQLVELIAGAARRRCPQAMTVLRGDQFVVLLPGPHGDANCSAALAAGVIESVRQQIPGLTVSAGLGEVAAGPAGLARAYREAEEALTVVRKLGGTSKALAYGELGVYGLVLRSSAREDLLRLARRWVGPLEEYERRRGVGLLATLECYFAHGCDARQVAAALFVHPNTVKHRLRLAGELTGAELSDLRQLLELQLALLIYRLHRRAEDGSPAP